VSTDSGPVVLVTGALGDIGRATAVLLAEAGVTVVVTDLADPAAESSIALIRELESAGGRASYRMADQAVESEVQSVVEFILDTYGRLDGAANIAAVAQPRTPLVEMASADFARITHVNVVGVFHWVKHELLAMSAGGSIVNMSSAQGVMGVANQVAYTTSRHAVCGLTRAAAVEAGERGIRVNAVLPGSVRTAMQEAVHGALDSPENLARARGLHLLGRIAEVGEVGRTVRWLLSEESSFITGALVPVDGGLTSGRRV
jgi:2,5-dichloro-2,5-cyclohexadiene-1,4-diol dehydrogenase 1